mgnify:CR=1 FL=1
MLTLSTPRFLRARRGASLTEYAVLSGVLGAAVIGSILTLGGEAVQGTETGTAALQDAFYVAEAPVAPPSGGVEGEGGSGEGAEAPPSPFADCVAQIEALGGPDEFGIILYTRGNGPDRPPSVGLDGLNTIAVLGADAVATWDTPTSGRVVSSDGVVEFVDYDRFFLCDAGGEVFPPPPPPPPVPALFGWYQGAPVNVGVPGSWNLVSDTSATASVEIQPTTAPLMFGSTPLVGGAFTESRSWQVVATEPFVRSSSLSVSSTSTPTLISTHFSTCLLYTSPSPRDGLLSRMPSSA